MKKVVLSIVFTILTLFTAMAQQWQDVVYLKNGSIVKGMIIEQIPDESLKIQTANGNVFVCQMVDVLKITKEQNTIAKDAYTGINDELASLQFSGYEIVNAEGTVFTRSQMCEILGQAKADELYRAISTWKIAGPISLSSITIGAVPFGVRLMVPSGVKFPESWLVIGLIAEVIGISSAVLTITSYNKAHEIIDEYTSSTFAMRVSPTILQTVTPIGVQVAPGVTIALNL
ncbi:MAG: hypothetical protein IJR25_07635 [Bacteroidales bacterium]|nr:hypothetical protein [Bacteroidales bacterium]